LARVRRVAALGVVVTTTTTTKYMRVPRTLLALGVLAICFTLFSTDDATADYADGAVVVAKTKSVDDAVKVWRMAAWQQDDFLAQTELGKIYADHNRDDRDYYDPIESYVWYFLATRPYRNWDTDYGQLLSERYYEAQSALKRMYGLLTQEQKAEARNRIIYILAGRGAGGFLSLAQLYLTQQTDVGISDEAIYACVYRPSLSRLFQNWLWRLFHRHTEPKIYNGDLKPILISDLRRFETNVGLSQCVDSRGRRKPLPPHSDTPRMPTYSVSVIDQNNDEALMYADIAQNLNHPLAASYVKTIVSGIRQENIEDVNVAEDTATKRANVFSLPFEFYPGATIGNTPHSDERVIGYDERQAQYRFLKEMRGKYDYAIRQALYATGRLRQPPFTRTPPAEIDRAVRDFQKKNRFEVTGALTVGQAIRLIKTAAQNGDMESQDTLGVMYANGGMYAKKDNDEGVVHNYPRAEYWFLAATRQQDCNAMMNLSFLYEKGVEGVPQNQDKAAYYRELAKTTQCKIHPHK
jgi:hypothetical protein